MWEVWQGSACHSAGEADGGIRRAGEARNDAAIDSHGLTGQKMTVLDTLASGRANKAFARSPGL